MPTASIGRLSRRLWDWVVRGAAALAMLVALRSPLAAQSAPAGTLTGRVTDARTGAPIPSAIVLIPGTLFRTTTGADGRYAVSGVAPGRYTIRVFFLGYESGTASDVDVRAGATTRADVALRKGIVQLPEITVTASGREQESGTAPASQATLSNQEITSRNVVTLEDALPFVPGVELNHGDLDIRGATGVAGGVGSRVLMLLDGHPVLTADGSEIDFSSIPLLDIDRVEVVKGAYSALYGSNALGGVVNVITTPIEPVPETIVRAHYGLYDVPADDRFTSHQLDFKGFGLQQSQRIGDVGARLMVGRQSSDGFRQDDQSSQWLVHGKVAFPADGPHASSAYVVWSSVNEGNAFVAPSPDQLYKVPPQTINDWDHSTKLSTGATIVPYAGESAQLQVTPYVEHDFTQNHYYNNSDYHTATKLGSDAQFAITPSSRQTITVGGEAARTTVSSNFLGAPPSDTTLTTFAGRQAIDEMGAYAQDEVAIVPRLTGTFGARLDWRRVEGANTEVALNPKAAIVFRPTDALSMRLSVARGYRGPSVIEQFVSATQSGFLVLPDSTLKGERAWSSEVGARAMIGSRLWVDGALFQSDYYGLIGPAAVPGRQFTFEFRNVQRARIRGVDVSTRMGVLHDHADVQLAYTYLDTRDLGTGLPLPYRSLHNFTGTINVFNGIGGLDVRYRSRVQQVLAFPLDPRSDITVVDLRLEHRVFNTLVQAKVANLLQAKYVDVMERTPGAPRSFLLTALKQF